MLEQDARLAPLHDAKRVIALMKGSGNVMLQVWCIFALNNSIDPCYQ